jgi:hypothetical protein
MSLSAFIDNLSTSIAENHEQRDEENEWWLTPLSEQEVLHRGVCRVQLRA